MDTGLTNNSDPVEGFSGTCENCGSSDIDIEYEFNYYGGMTGWDQSLAIKCTNCKQETQLSTS